MNAPSMPTPLFEVLLPLCIGSMYLFMVLITTYLGRKSNLHWGYIAGASLLLSPIAGMVLFLWFGERMNSYQRVERLKQLYEQGILTEEEFEWKFRPATLEMLLREIAILRDEGVLTRSEYQAKVYKLIAQEEEDYSQKSNLPNSSLRADMVVS